MHGSLFFWFAFVALLGYGLGLWDGRKGRPPDPLRGTYEHVEEDDNGNYDI